MKNALCPPSTVREITVLNRDLFNRDIYIGYLLVNSRFIPNIQRIMDKYLLKLHNWKAIIKSNKNDQRQQSEIHLNPELVTCFQDINEEDKQKLKLSSIDEHCFHVKLFHLRYEHYSLEAIFGAILPKDKDCVSSFTTIGHIVQLNLRDHLLPYKKTIGQVLVDKVPNCRTVINKTDQISSTYRECQTELLAGENNMKATVRQNGVRFEFDFSKVYWNSRLSTEHERIVGFFQKNDVIFDVCAGVGPFCVPAASVTTQKSCRVYANDLNPEATKWLHHNFQMNKIPPSNYEIFNQDGLEFIREVFKMKSLQFMLNSKRTIYVLINLPASGVDFLIGFNGLFNRDQLIHVKCWPIIIVYCFVKNKTDWKSNAIQQVCDKLGHDINENIIQVFNVRTVSSFKYMIRVMFKLNANILSNSSDIAKGIKRPLE